MLESYNLVFDIKLNTVFTIHRCDVSNREEVVKTAEKVKKEVGDVTILINNAGIMPCRHFTDHTPEQIKRIFDINILAHFWVICSTDLFSKKFRCCCTRELNNLSVGSSSFFT